MNFKLFVVVVIVHVGMYVCMYVCMYVMYVCILFTYLKKFFVTLYSSF